MRRLIIIIVAIFASGCIKESEVDIEYQQRLVVNGSIEPECGAIVALSLNAPFSDRYDEEDFRNTIVRWAKVTVRCGEQSEVLIGRSNNDYPTRYIYTGSEIKGEVGKNYELIVEYSNRTWHATTTITQPAELCDIAVERLNDSLCSISATLPPIATPCAIDCALGQSQYFAPTMLGTYASCDEPRRITISRPLDNLYRNEYTTSFNIGDTVRLKLRTMDHFSYQYWSQWENNVINSLNPIFPATDNLPTNISDDAIGIWAGYGSTIYRLGILEEFETM